MLENLVVRKAGDCLRISINISLNKFRCRNERSNSGWGNTSIFCAVFS